jgi:prepilin-type N-terminal cleavage/methylation domain-containing protein
MSGGRGYIYDNLQSLFYGVDKMNRQGFTVLEMIMVILIVAILAVMSIPRFESYYTIKLEGAARKLVSDIRYAQRLAIARHETYGVEFNTGSDSYRLFRASDNSTATDPLTRSDMIIDFTAQTEYRGIDLSSANFGGTNKVQFNSLGAPQDGTGSALTSTGIVTISYKGGSKSVTVTPNTGMVSLQ